MFHSIAKLEQSLTRVNPLYGQGRALWVGGSIAVLALALGYGVHGVELDASRRVFQQRARNVRLSLEAHLSAPLEALRSLPPYFMASSLVERQEFADYVASALERHPAIELFAWAPEVTEGERSRFESQARRVGWPDYHIWQLGRQDEIEPATSRAVYMPLLQVEPPRPDLVGLDLLSIVEQRTAIREALRSGKVRGALPLRGDAPSAGSLTLYAPVSRLRTRDPDPRAPRRGVALTALHVAPLVAASLTPVDAEEIDVVILEKNASDAGDVLFESDPGLWARVPQSGPNVREEGLSIAGRNWTVRFVARPGVISAGSSPFVVAGLGCLLALVGVLAMGALEVARRLQSEMRRAHQLGPYKLLRKLGEGGMGAVYEAEHALLRRPTAVKVILPRVRSAELIERFEREVTLTSQLSHPNTIAIYDFGHTAEGVFYYSMEYLPGLNVADLVTRLGPLPPGRVVHLLVQVCGSLREAHDRGLVHRDIKPSNLMVCERGGIGDFIKVLDFGLVKEIRRPEDSKLTHDGSVLGTPRYMAPELLFGAPQPSPASDIYAVGAVAYFMLSGHEVFEDLALPALVSGVLQRDPEPPSTRVEESLPPALEALVLRCLSRDPHARPQSALELRHLLETCGVPAWTEERATRCWRESVAPVVPFSRSSEMATADTVAVEN